MDTAKIVNWNPQKGFGFALVDGQRAFVHSSALNPEPYWGSDMVGKEIVFEENDLVKGERGLKILFAWMTDTYYHMSAPRRSRVYFSHGRGDQGWKTLFIGLSPEERQRLPSDISLPIGNWQKGFWNIAVRGAGKKWEVISAEFVETEEEFNFRLQREHYAGMTVEEVNGILSSLCRDANADPLFVTERWGHERYADKYTSREALIGAIEADVTEAGIRAQEIGPVIRILELSPFGVHTEVWNNGMIGVKTILGTSIEVIEQYFKDRGMPEIVSRGPIRRGCEQGGDDWEFLSE